MKTTLRITRATACGFLALCFATAAAAQSTETPKPRPQPATGQQPSPTAAQGVAPSTSAPAPPAMPASGVRADILTMLKDAEDKLYELAGAMPQEKYSWRPGEGVRSVSEVYLHVALANYFLPTLIGMARPQGVDPKTFETSTSEKEQVIRQLKDSFANARNAIASTPDADLDGKVKIFDHEGTKREALLLVVTHAHEHLGQSIAYARSNGVVPPWTARRQAAQPAAR